MTEPRQPSRFQRRPPGTYPEVGFEITGGFLTISGEQRRQICQNAINQGLVKIGRADIQVSGEIQYVRNVSRGFEDANVRVDLAVPVTVDPSGAASLNVTVPPHQDWGERVITTVLQFVLDWASQQP